VIGQLLQMALLLVDSLAELNKLLLLALTDSVVLVGLLPALEGVSVFIRKRKLLAFVYYPFCLASFPLARLWY